MTDAVSDLVMACVAENAAWCALVARTHGIGTERSGGWTRTLRHAPAYHPDLITLDPTVTSEEVAAQLRDRPDCSVKDSFGILDLSGHGFERLFDADWLALPDLTPDVNVKSPKPAGPVRLAPGWHQVSDVDAFRRWVAGLAPDTPLRPALLDDANTRIWLLEEADHVAGFVAHRTQHVVAVTNAFAGGRDAATSWRDLIALANRGWGSASGSLRVVCYEHGDDLVSAHAAGFESHGRLTVWVRAAAAAL
ncbi:MAG TPA: hypothetical protein VH419_16465 [Nocardioidaceae bacterium]